MITTIEQATKVQEIRIAKGKQGHSKAVRAFCKHGLNLQNVGDYNKYLSLKLSLPALDIGPKAKQKVIDNE